MPTAVWCPGYRPYLISLFLRILDSLHTFHFYSDLWPRPAHPTHQCSLLLPLWCCHLLDNVNVSWNISMYLNSFWIPVTHFKSHFLGLDITFLDSTHLSPIVKALLKVICKVWVGDLACLFSLSYTPSCVFAVRPSPFCDPESSTAQQLFL